MSDIIKFTENSNEHNEFYAEIMKKKLDHDDDWYYGDTEMLTNSMMSELKKSPLHLQRYLNKIREPEKDFNVFGRAFHCSVLEPDEFLKRFFVLDDRKKCEEIGGAKPRGTKAYREWKAEMLEGAVGKSEVSIEDYDMIMRMTEKLNDIPETRNLLDIVQKEIIFADEYQGIKRKCKVDGIKPGDFLIDLKSTKDPVSQFPGSFFRYDYDRQGAWYSDITMTPNVIIIAVEKAPPFTVGIYYLSDMTLDNGRTKYEAWMLEYKRLFIDQEVPNLNRYLIQSSI
jgi:hypothetical protein